MNNKSFAKVAASGLMLGSALLGFGPAGDYVGSLSSASARSPQTDAATFAKRARVASAKGQIDLAVTMAEKAVATAPTNADYRMLLGDTYLKAGRFTSAEASFDDALSLVPDNSRAALKLTLAKIATGKNDAARTLLDEHREQLSAADYGLAVGLSGDLQGAIQVLEASARGDGDALTRQNLALVYALSGRWAEARTTAAQDLSPDLIDQRMTQWAMMARPKASWDQVASVLGVTPAYDMGQPAALALNMGAASPAYASSAVQAPAEIAASEQSSEPSPVFEAPSANQAEPVQVAAVAPAPAFSPSSASGIAFAPRQEIVQVIRESARAETPLVRSQSKPMKTALAAPARRKPFVAEKAGVPRSLAALAPTQKIVAPQSGRELKSGQFAVQLGAFASKVQAEAAWARAAAKSGKLAGHKPMVANVTSGGKALKRLAAAGYTSRESAEAACNDVKTKGGECFVRSFAGVELAQWVGLNASPSAKPVKLAVRKPVPAPAKPVKIAARKPVPATAPAKPVKVSAAKPAPVAAKPVKIAAR
jgi:Flp pilus assembly protein TadD